MILLVLSLEIIEHLIIRVRESLSNGRLVKPYPTKTYLTKTYPHFGQNVTIPKRTQFVTNTNHTVAYFWHNKDKNTRDTRKEGKKSFI